MEYIINDTSTLEIKSKLLKQDRSRLSVFFREVSKVINQKCNLKVLDIGSGTGAIVNILSERFPKNNYYCTDVYPINFADVNFEANNAQYEQNDFNYPSCYSDDSFDLVLAGEVIEHLHNTDNFFVELKRILKPNGIAIITTPNLSSFLDRCMLLMGFLPSCMEVSNSGRHFGRKMLVSKSSPSVGHLRVFTWSALKDLCEYYNLEVSGQHGAWHHDNFINKIFPYLIKNLSQQQVIVLKNLKPALKYVERG